MKLEKTVSRKVALFFVGVFSVWSLAGFLNAEPPPGQSRPSREPPPGEGVLCLWGLTNAAAEIGRHCREGQNPAFQAELERSVGRFDDYVVRNGVPPDQVARFKREQGLSGAPQSQLCSGELLAFYDHMAAQGSEALRAEVDRLVSRPGRPSWADCV